MQDDYAVMTCASLMDEIWVPSKWHRSVFLQFLQSFGFTTPEIIVVPESVDTSLFDPRLEPSRRHESLLCDNSTRTCPAFNRPFEFLSIFKWEYRKGWDILLDAYWSAFA